jgi:hypothetical protein
MSARQVVEMVAQKGQLLAPLIGRQQSEYLGTTIARELDVLAEERLLPPWPIASNRQRVSTRSSGKAR